MKTTVELSDELLTRSRAVARREGSTLRALLEEGLQLALKRRALRAKPETPTLPVYGRLGLSEGFRDADWATIRDELHRLPVAEDPSRR
jgi:hypothetical protein